MILANITLSFETALLNYIFEKTLIPCMLDGKGGSATQIRTEGYILPFCLGQASGLVRVA